jgi:hypothetical protein
LASVLLGTEGAEMNEAFFLALQELTFCSRRWELKMTSSNKCRDMSRGNGSAEAKLKLFSV